MERACDWCGATYIAKRATSRFCRATCRATSAKAARKGTAKPEPKPRRLSVVTEEAPKRKRGGGTEPRNAETGPEVPPEPVGPLTDATRAELARLESVGTPAGQLALRLARLLDDPPPLALGSVAGWARELRAAMAEVREQAAAAGVGRRESPLDRVRSKRDGKLAGLG